MIEESMRECESKMKQSIESLVADFKRYRTGRANPVILERVHVDYYGTDTPVSQVANISIPDGRQIVITPYEKHMISTIEKAIQKSDLGITPMNDGLNIRLVFPPMTEESRKEIVKQINGRTEQACVSIRNIRREILDVFKQSKKNKVITEDDLKSVENRVQKVTDKYVAEAHEEQKKKETEIMSLS